jgi:hypothetical protein
MKLFLTTMALLLTSVPAIADAPGNASTRDTQAITQEWTNRTFDFPGDNDWFRVQLSQGSDYYVSVQCVSCRFDVRNYSGKILARGSTTDDSGPEGFQFRPSYKGLFFLEVVDNGTDRSYPDDYLTIVSGDCPAGWLSHCFLSPGDTKTGTLTDGHDADAFLSDLRAGQSYTLTLTYPDGTGDREFFINDTDDNIVWYGGTTTFTPTKSGTYRITVTSEDTNTVDQTYTLALTGPPRGS